MWWEHAEGGAATSYHTLLPSPHSLLSNAMQVGAPSLPNLLGALDPFSGEPTTRRGGAAGLDPYKLLSSLAVGECSLPASALPDRGSIRP